MSKKELLDNRPLMPKLSLIGYILCSLIAIFLIAIGTFVLVDNIKYTQYGDEVEAYVDAVVENETERKVYITYEYNNKTYSHKDLKRWNEELDINSKVTINVLKDNPEEFRVSGDYALIVYLVYAISLILIALSVIEFIKFFSERNRIYKLLTEGNKQEGVVISVEQMSERNTYGTLPWCMTVKINDTVFDSCKNYIKFNLKGAIGYLVDIYIDKNNSSNYYVDLISIRRDKDNNVVGVDNYEQ